MTRAPHHALGPAALVVGGVLLAAALIAIAIVPQPTGSVQAWLGASTGLLAASNELLAFACLALTAGSVALYRSVGARHSGRATVALSASALALVAAVVAVAFEGRLAYPIPGLPLAEAASALAASGFYGALHMALLFFGFSLAAWGLAAAGLVRAITLTAAVLLLPASYPWLTPTWLEIAAACAVALWGGCTGFWLLSETRVSETRLRESRVRDAAPPA